MEELNRLHGSDAELLRAAENLAAQVSDLRGFVSMPEGLAHQAARCAFRVAVNAFDAGESAGLLAGSAEEIRRLGEEGRAAALESARALESLAAAAREVAGMAAQNLAQVERCAGLLKTATVSLQLLLDRTDSG